MSITSSVSKDLLENWHKLSMKQLSALSVEQRSQIALNILKNRNCFRADINRLIEFGGIDITYQEENSTILAHAIKKGCERIIGMALDEGIEIPLTAIPLFDGVDCDLFVYTSNLLYVALFHRNRKLVQILIDKSYDINSDLKYHYTNEKENGVIETKEIIKSPLRACIDQNLYGYMKMLLKGGTSPNQMYSDQTSVLTYAIQKKKIKLTSLLLSAGADPNIQDADKQTPLFWALFMDSEQLLKMLLEAKANPNLQNIYGGTPLHYTSGRNYELLEKYGADSSIRNNSNLRPARSPDELLKNYLEDIRNGPNPKEKLSEFLETFNSIYKTDFHFEF